METVEVLHAYFCLLLASGLLSLTVSASVHPGARQDVMGQYRLTNRQQCHRLCWYRALCGSYSYHTESSAPLMDVSTPPPNCVLHAQNDSGARDDNTTRAGGWEESSASSSHIKNGCKARPCRNTHVCVPKPSTSVPTSSTSVPTSPTSVPTSSQSASYVCLPLPSHCADPDLVSHGDVVVFGNSQDDVAHVTCDVGYVASPRNVSMEIVCLVTSTWTTFEGRCAQYEFLLNAASSFWGELPWRMVENSQFCVKGVFTEAGQMAMNLKPDPQHLDVHVSFRYQFYGETRIIWDTMVNKVWQKQRELGDMPLVPGDSFNITGHLHNDSLTLTLNEAHVYSIPLGRLQDGIDGIDVSQSTLLDINGKVELTYINLISAC